MSPAGRRRHGWWWVLVLAVVVMLLVRAFLVQSFSVSSASMEPTIQPGERLLVSRLVRGDSVHRGDIVVFDGARAFGNGEPSDDGVVTRAVQAAAWLLSVDTGTDYVKRVVGVPGDQVICCDPSGRLVVNHVAVQESYLFPGDAPSELTFDVTVPPDRIWVMGDHRSDSSDSRFHDDGTGATGSVPIQDITGRAVMVVWPIDNVTWLSVPSRIFETVPSKPATTPGGTNTPVTTPSGPPAGIPTKAG